MAAAGLLYAARNMHHFTLSKIIDALPQCFASAVTLILPPRQVTTLAYLIYLSN